MDLFSALSRIKNSWTRTPEQVKRLTVILVIFIAVFIPLRRLLVPADFGKYGHYRASALEENAAQDIKYAGHEICNDCHDDVVEIKSEGYHKNVSCEVCHGAAAAHVDEPDGAKPTAPRDRGSCPLCHGYLPSRPTGFPQIVAASHNPLKPCITCHDPHNPVTPEKPAECLGCHAEIARTKAVSHHIYVPCVRCHETPEEHKVNPRGYRPGKPADREFCGECHAEGAADADEIRKIDMVTHGERYVCWQCHYPHSPEAK